MSKVPKWTRKLIRRLRADHHRRPPGKSEPIRDRLLQQEFHERSRK